MTDVKEMSNEDLIKWAEVLDSITRSAYNTRNLVNFERVCLELEERGYEVAVEPELKILEPTVTMKV